MEYSRLLPHIFFGDFFGPRLQFLFQFLHKSAVAMNWFLFQFYCCSRQATIDLIRANLFYVLLIITVISLPSLLDEEFKRLSHSLAHPRK